MAVRFILSRLGVEHRLELVDRSHQQQRSDHYLAMNPTGRIPTLIDDDLVLFESPAICLHLARRFPEHCLIPSDIHSRAVFDQWLMYLSNTVQSELMIHFYPERYSDDPLAELKVKRASEERVIAMLELLDQQLKGSDYLLGRKIRVCDYFLFMLCVWADELKQPPLSFPNLSAYLKRLASLDEIIEICKHEGLSLAAYH